MPFLRTLLLDRGGDWTRGHRVTIFALPSEPSEHWLKNTSLDFGFCFIKRHELKLFTDLFHFSQFSCFKGISAKKETTITKIISMMFGLLATGMAFMCSSLGSLISLGGKIFGATMGPMFAYVLVSILLPPVNLKGSSIGLVIGQAINIW